MQIQLYAPQRDHPNYGVLRAIVRDRTDGSVNGSMPFYLDSDGCVSDPGCSSAQRNTTVVRRCA